MERGEKGEYRWVHARHLYRDWGSMKLCFKVFSLIPVGAFVFFSVVCGFADGFSLKMLAMWGKVWGLVLLIIWAAGIGANGPNSAIFIEGGTIKAVAGELTGVRSAAAIGPSGTDSHCGDITITGGSCDLEGGPDCPGIGIARRGSSCGRITIGDGVTLLKIKRGERAKDHIAAITRDWKPGVVTIATSLSQTYSDDKSTLILGHGGRSTE